VSQIFSTKLPILSGAEREPDPELVRWILSLTLGATLSSVVLLLLVVPSLPVLHIVAGVSPYLLLYGAALLIVHKGHPNVAANLYLWGTLVLQALVLYAASDVREQAYISFMNLVLAAGYLKGRWASLGVGGASLVVLLVVHWLGMVGQIPEPFVPVPEAGRFVALLSTLLATCGLSFIGTRFTSEALTQARESQVQAEGSQARAERAFEALEEVSRTDVARLKKAERLASMARGVVALSSPAEMASEVSGALVEVVEGLQVVVTDLQGHVLSISGAPASTGSRRLSWTMTDTGSVVERRLLDEELADLSQVLGVEAEAGYFLAGNQSPVSLVLLGTEETLLDIERDWQVDAAWHVVSTGVHRIHVESALSQSQRMDALGRLSAGVAHDFNNLLTSILGGAELAALRVKGDPKAEKYIESLREAAERAAGLTRKLMLFTASASQGPKALDVVDLLEALLPVMRRSIEERIDVLVVLPDEDVWVQADPVDLERALLNLVFNARDAIAEHGEIEVGVELRETSSGEWRVVIWVSDTGCGIPSELHGKVFEPFFSMRRGQGAAGLGLSEVYGVVQAAGGEVMLASEPGEGTRVELFFVPHAAPVAGEVPRPSPTFESAQGRILVVEDDIDVRETLCEMLEVAGYVISTAENGEDALRVFAEEGPFALVLSDVVMPKMGGFELVAQMRAEHPGTPIALVSGYAPTRQFGDQDTTIPMITKPFTLKRLLGFVGELVGS
jgi:signal transduction histidine kinase/CheY-like chemotaxis protein